MYRTRWEAESDGSGDHRQPSVCAEGKHQIHSGIQCHFAIFKFLKKILIKTPSLCNYKHKGIHFIGLEHLGLCAAFSSLLGIRQDHKRFCFLLFQIQNRFLFFFCRVWAPKKTNQEANHPVILENHIFACYSLVKHTYTYKKKNPLKRDSFRIWVLRKKKPQEESRELSCRIWT